MGDSHTANTAKATNSLSTSFSLPTTLKHLSLLTLSIAIISTIGLNILRSYSVNNLLAKAESSNTNTNALASDSSSTTTCDPTNTNAPSCISIGITSSSSATGGSDTSTLSLQIPQEGGIATGRHTVNVKTNNITGYNLSLTAEPNIAGESNAALINTNHPSSYIAANPVDLSQAVAKPLQNNTWGMAVILPDRYDDWNGYFSNEQAYLDKDPNALYIPVPTKQQSSIYDYIIHPDVPSLPTGDDFKAYYSIRVDHPNELLAGDYTTQVVYTATVREVPQPTISSTTPNTYEFDSCNNSQVTITGTNLSSVYDVYLQKPNATDEANRLECTNLSIESSSKLTCTIPTDKTKIEPTTYDLYVVSQSTNPGILRNAFTYIEQPKGLSIKSDHENIIVDYDQNMIPITYKGNDSDGNAIWAVVTDEQQEQDTANWFRYGTTPDTKQWANAITVTKESRDYFRKKQTGEDTDPTFNTVNNPDILGYWVYIPRYAYEVQRRDAVDKPVDPQDFNIIFQTANEKNTPLPTTSTGTDHKDYRTSNSSHRTYSPGTSQNPNSSTTWATHPAFTWGNTELNGLWVGKFETTGKINAPTVKPNQHANVYNTIGEFYTAAKSIGKSDQCNVGGSPVSGITQNSHNLYATTSHMLKNSEWGAITYLAHSAYGAGINDSYTRKTNVNKNGAHPSTASDADGTSSGYGITGCGPSSAGSTSYYTDGTPLDENTIESPTACSTSNTERSYNGNLGVLASTTNNTYGIYDTSGGVYEYMASSYTTTNQSSNTNFTTRANTPYVDLYKTSNGFGTKPSWSSGSSAWYYNYDVCTFETCGGSSTFETNTQQSVSGSRQSWGGSSSYFVSSSYPWFYRGSNSNGSDASPFYTDLTAGNSYTDNGFRSALLARPSGQ